MKKELIENTVKKLSNWIETAPGQNDEEAANLFFLNQILAVLNDKDNDLIDELNVLIIRLALFRIKDHKTNEQNQKPEFDSNAKNKINAQKF